MRILAVDIGTGTQDILVFDTALQPENCFKLVLPSPTMTIARQVREAAHAGQPLLLRGVTMGGGPSHWAVRDHASAGNEVFATPDAARTFDDDLERVEEMGIRIVSEDEVRGIRARHTDLITVEMRDFDYDALAAVLERVGISTQLHGISVAVFDHGAAPPGTSDRQFRLDYLDSRIREHNRLSAFAYPAGQTPSIMTRLEAVVDSARTTGLPENVPLMVMDTAPAAVLGALQDSQLADQRPVIVANVGNFHTLAFRLGEAGIEGVFEHHTGLLDAEKLDRILAALADSSLRHEDVFNDDGHGALLYASQPMPAGTIGVTGPRRRMMLRSRHPTYFAVPFGDMMIAGCYGMLRAWMDVFPDDREEISASLQGAERGAPWDAM